MKYPEIELKKLKPHPKNPRTHTDEQIAKIRASIEELGWGRPIIISSDFYILAGHGAALAAEAMGEKKVPYRQMAYKHDTPEAIAYMLVDNKLTDESDWDYGKLELAFDELKLEGFNLELTGFDELELNAFNVDPDFGFLNNPEQNNPEPGEPTTPGEPTPNIEGSSPGRSFSIHISFSDKARAEQFMRFIGLKDPEMKGLTKLVDGDNIVLETEGEVE